MSRLIGRQLTVAFTPAIAMRVCPRGAAGASEAESDGRPPRLAWGDPRNRVVAEALVRVERARATAFAAKRSWIASVVTALAGHEVPRSPA